MQLHHSGTFYKGVTKDLKGPHYPGAPLAGAEHWAQEIGLEVEWRDDWGVSDHVAEYDCYEENPDTCQWAHAVLNGQSMASLGCIDDADDHYRRVVEAELALEVKGSLCLAQ